MQIVPSPRSTQQHPRRAASVSFTLLGSILGAAALTGCAGIAPKDSGLSEPVSAIVHYSGSVMGGQQPVAGATIQLMTVGTTGLGSASTNILTSSTTSDSNGNFSLTGKYTCGSATQVYLLATGGNPGSGTNTNIALAAALGSCSTLLANANTTFITVNEVTTIGAAYGLAPFAANGTSIGANGSNPTGLVNAFGNAASLANTANGTAGGTNVPAGTTVPVAKLYTLADILASCVNSTGAASSGCSTLFAATSATDTFSAAIAIAKNPGASANTALYNQVGPTAPFQPTLSTQPKDFSVALVYSPTTPLVTPYGIAIDAYGDAYVTNEASSIFTTLSPTGALLFSQDLMSGGFGAQSVAVARNGTVWIAATASNNVYHCTPITGLAGAPTALGCSAVAAGGNGPAAIALDSANNAFVANFNSGSVTEESNSGTVTGTYTGNGNITNPTAIALDPSGNVYVASGNGTAVQLTNAGAYTSSLTDNTLQGPVGLAVDTSSRTFLAGFTTGTAVAGGVSEFGPTGAPVLSAPLSAGISTPAGVATDGTSAWVVNSTTSGSLAKITYGASATASPTAGFGLLNTPVGVAVDSTGSVWTTNSGSNTVSKFIGIAVPVVTPLAANVGP